MEADDNFQTGLPVPMRGSEGKIGIDFDLETYLLKMRQGVTQSFNFQSDVDEIVETEGHYAERRQADARNIKLLDPETQKELNSLDYLYDVKEEQALRVMFGNFDEAEKLMQNVTDDGGVKKRILRPGTGPRVEQGNMVVIHYMVGCELMDDLIESTYAKDKRPQRFRIGEGRMIPVFDMGIVGMRVGEKSKFLATWEYGYGKLGVPVSDTLVVPPEVKVMVQVEVIETYKCGADDAISLMPSSERAELPFEKLLTYVEETKNEGNREFRQEEFDRAVKAYLDALEVLKDMQPITPLENQQYFKVRRQLCTNLAQCYFKLERYRRALKYAEDGVNLPCTAGELQKAKCLFWCAKIKFEMGDYNGALESIKSSTAIRFDKDTRALELKINAKVKEAQEKEKEVCARIFKMKI